jgi:hypothetical protein
MLARHMKGEFTILAHKSLFMLFICAYFMLVLAIIGWPGAGGEFDLKTLLRGITVTYSALGLSWEKLW